MTDNEIEKILLTKRAEIEALLAQTDADTAPVALDQTQQGRLSRMDAMQQQAMAAETQRRRLRDIQLINGALQRMKDGEYGYCVTCGEAVEAEHLKLDPATPFCISHAR